MANNDSEDFSGVDIEFTGLTALIKQIIISEVRSDPAFAQAFIAAIWPQLQGQVVKIARSNNSVGTLTPRKP